MLGKKVTWLINYKKISALFLISALASSVLVFSTNPIMAVPDLQGTASIAGSCGADADPAVTDLDTLFNLVPSGDFLITITNTGNAPAEFQVTRTLCLNDMDVDRPCTLKFAVDPGVSFADKTEVPVDPASTQLAEVVPAFAPITRQFDWRLELASDQDILDDMDKDQRVTVTVSAICDRVDGNPRQVCPVDSSPINGNCICDVTGNPPNLDVCPAPVIEFCGDGTVNDAGNEQCDGSDLDGMTCVDFGFVFGDLACDDSCNFDTSGCIED